MLATLFRRRPRLQSRGSMQHGDIALVRNWYCPFSRCISRPDPARPVIYRSLVLLIAQSFYGSAGEHTESIGVGLTFNSAQDQFRYACGNDRTRTVCRTYAVYNQERRKASPAISDEADNVAPARAEIEQ